MENKKMDYEGYLKGRLEEQIGWYEKKSTLNKRIYFILRIIEIIAASSIPFMVGYITEKTTEFKIVVGLLGVFIAIITGIVALIKCQELWIEYRNTGELLKQQRYLFETGAKPYDGDEAFRILVENVENIMAKERAIWSQQTTEKREDKKR